jgi:hypothetical protein
VTAKELLIHAKGKTPYHVANTTHFIQCANERIACPIFPGDTRITMCWVEMLDPIDKIAKNDLFDALKKEAPDFLAEVLNIEIPKSNDRLKIPVIVTGDKIAAAAENMTPLETFLKDHCYYIPGKVIKYRDFYDKFKEHTPSMDLTAWTIIKVGRNLPPQHPKGRLSSDPNWYIGNISFSPLDDGEPKLSKLILVDDKLVSSVIREETK